MKRSFLILAVAGLICGVPSSEGAEMLRPASERFAERSWDETPDFQRHVLPLLGRQGCNGRACHGSFQGRGGLRLSLFGYDFTMDHDALTKGDDPRIDLEFPDASLMLLKPTMEEPHEGGQRLEEGTWQYRLLTNWIKNGAKAASSDIAFDRLEVIPDEIVFNQKGQTEPLRVIAHWSDGTVEDVTCLSRFRTNDESITDVSEEGIVKSIGKGDTAVVAFYDNGVFTVPTMMAVSDRVGDHYPDVPTPTKVDRLVVEKLRKLGLVPSELCSDTEFLRRVSIDMTGTLPTPQEIEAFVADQSSDKRARKIDELLERPSYSSWWATKLSDLTGNNPRDMQTFGPTMSKQWQRWVEERIEKNEPYDELIAGMVEAVSRRPGQSYQDYCAEMSKRIKEDDPEAIVEHDSMPYFWFRRSLRKPEEKALAFSYAFLGVRLQCAQCHKHPFDQWTQDDFNQFTAFFNGVSYGYAKDARGERTAMIKELSGGEKKLRMNDYRRLVREGKVVPFSEVFVNDRAAKGRRSKKNNKTSSSRVITPKLLGGEEVILQEFADPRSALMEWMRGQNNPYFARAFVNRVWANYFNVGIVDPPDDLNLANPPSNPALLDDLTKRFVESGYDMKWLHREIANSRTYQLSSKPNATNVGDERNFSRAVVRRLPAEVVVDAIKQATASDRELASWHETIENRAISGRVGRNRRGQGDYALTTFGIPARETNCDCERSVEPNLTQALYMFNDDDIETLMTRSGGWLDDVAGISRKNASVESAKDRDALEARLRKARENLKTINRLVTQRVKQGDKKEAERLRGKADKLRQRLKQANERLAQLDKESKRPSSPNRVAATNGKSALANLDALIRDVYLRTVSRPPTMEEASRARAHVQTSADPGEGLRDLLWAMLNTKEFIVNH
ncbi:hypothetical protein Pan216_43220 [Planctomycetes bacterium Pan216]|uniref:BIG2 domain-containing protein n=1 Tax=Kolteria novifilia TaxID=2527975 RepID=A0A518B914_9BACT|nr:hypothetical protein Pan216_43220 [Planctomycetes bacterium Pan216]